MMTANANICTSDVTHAQRSYDQIPIGNSLKSSSTLVAVTKLIGDRHRCYLPFSLLCIFRYPFPSPSPYHCEKSALGLFEVPDWTGIVLSSLAFAYLAEFFFVVCFFFVCFCCVFLYFPLFCIYIFKHEIFFFSVCFCFYLLFFFVLKDYFFDFLKF
jgi:hypothetical protein